MICSLKYFFFADLRDFSASLFEHLFGYSICKFHIDLSSTLVGKHRADFDSQALLASNCVKLFLTMGFDIILFVYDVIGKSTYVKLLSQDFSYQKAGTVHKSIAPIRQSAN